MQSKKCENLCQLKQCGFYQFVPTSEHIKLSWLVYLQILELNWYQLRNVIFFYCSSIYKFGLSVWVFVCLFVCLYPINVKTAEPIGPKFFVRHHVTTGKVYEWSKFQIFVSIKIRSSLNFWKFGKSTIFCENPRIIFVLFYDVHKVN